jgi:hypothetical protein
MSATAEPPRSELEAELQQAQQLTLGLIKQLGIAKYARVQETQEKERLKLENTALRAEIARLRGVSDGDD